jgi:hypothetical protein
LDKQPADVQAALFGTVSLKTFLPPDAKAESIEGLMQIQPQSLSCLNRKHD